PDDGGAKDTTPFDPSVLPPDPVVGEVARFKGDDNYHVTRVAFSPDGTCILSGGNDKKMHLWNVKDLKEELVFTSHAQAVSELTFRNEGRGVLSTDIIARETPL